MTLIFGKKLLFVGSKQLYGMQDLTGKRERVWGSVL
jgi:hypothetical protein